MGINLFNQKSRQDSIPDEFKEIAKDFSEKGFITTSSENLINWARTGSLHWMTFGLSTYRQCAFLIGCILYHNLVYF